MTLDCIATMTAACAEAFEEFLAAPKRSPVEAVRPSWTSTSTGGDANLDAIENIILSSSISAMEAKGRAVQRFIPSVLTFFWFLLIAYLCHSEARRRGRQDADRFPAHIVVGGFLLFSTTTWGLVYAILFVVIFTAINLAILGEEHKRDPDDDHHPDDGIFQ
jgi:hypothetical protein